MNRTPRRHHPDAELVVVDHAGHFLMENQPPRVRSEVLDFLALMSGQRVPAGNELTSGRREAR